MARGSIVEDSKPSALVRTQGPDEDGGVPRGGTILRPPVTRTFQQMAYTVISEFES